MSAQSWEFLSSIIWSMPKSLLRTLSSLFCVTVKKLCLLFESRKGRQCTREIQGDGGVEEPRFGFTVCARYRPCWTDVAIPQKCDTTLKSS